jgi:hypothetical protein
VLKNTISQPTNDTPMIAVAMVGSLTYQSTAGIGRPCQYSRTSARLVSSTQVLRSIGLFLRS